MTSQQLPSGVLEYRHVGPAELAQVFPDARFVEVPGARTFVSLEAADAVAREVEAIQAR